MQRMTSVHRCTAQIEDPDLPVVSTLLGAQPPLPLRAAVDTAGGTLLSALPSQVTWWPGSSITVRYDAVVKGGAMAGGQDFVMTAGRIPEGALVVDAGGQEVGVWRVPHDPALPGMASALDPDQAGRLLDGLGVPGAAVKVSLRAYRPGRRAVIAVGGRSHGLYLKLVRTGRVEPLHRHQFHRDRSGCGRPTGRRRPSPVSRWPDDGWRAPTGSMRGSLRPWTERLGPRRTGDAAAENRSIDLRDSTSITEITTVSTVPTTIADALDRLADSLASDSLDSPFDDSLMNDDPPASLDSVSVESPASPVSVSADSPDSPDSPDSADSGTWDSGSADS